MGVLEAPVTVLYGFGEKVALTLQYNKAKGVFTFTDDDGDVLNEYPQFKRTFTYLSQQGFANGQFTIEERKWAGGPLGSTVTIKIPDGNNGYFGVAKAFAKPENSALGEIIHAAIKDAVIKAPDGWDMFYVNRKTETRRLIEMAQQR